MNERARERAQNERLKNLHAYWAEVQVGRTETVAPVGYGGEPQQRERPHRAYVLGGFKVHGHELELVCYLPKHAPCGLSGFHWWGVLGAWFAIRSVDDGTSGEPAESAEQGEPFRRL